MSPRKQLLEIFRRAVWDIQFYIKAALIFALTSSVALSQESADTSFPADDNAHVVSESAGKFTAQLRETVVPKNVSSGVLEVYALVLPDLSSQRVTETSLKLDSKDEKKPPQGAGPKHDNALFLEQAMRLSRRSNGIPIDADALFKGELIKTRIEKGPPSNPVDPLPPADRRRYLSATPIMDHDSPSFRAWIRREGLTQRKGEGVLQFGFRVHNFIDHNYTHEPNAPQAPSRKPSETMKVTRSDCGGVGLLFVGIMRANGIPARTLWGRWAETQTDPDYGCWHVMPEFYVGGVGWIRALDKSFGRHGGNFITFHIDTDLEVDGKVRRGWAQSLIWEWRGVGDDPRVDASVGQWTVTRDAAL